MSTPLLAADLLLVFNAQPGATLLLSPAWVIVGASDDYLAATLTERDVIVGQHIFDAFPDNPDAPEADGVANVRASLQQVLTTKQPHDMAPQHYDVPDRARPGHFVERHWKPRHTPVLDAQGEVQFIIQSVQDITEGVLAERQLRDSQAAEQVARTEADVQRQRFYEVLLQLPAHVAVHEGPDQVFTFVNPGYQRIANGRALLGHPIRTVWPELADHGILDIFERVYHTGEPFTAAGLPVQADFTRTGKLEEVYYDFFFLALRDAQGQITGVLNFSYDVTSAVRARQQVEQLNQELEARVQERTREAERQRRQWEQLFLRVPAAVCIFDGPEWVYEFVNPGYQAMFPGRALLGKPLLDALPELHGQPLVGILRHVYDTGEPFQESEVLVPLARHEGGPIEDIYFDLTYLARYDEHGQIDGFVTYAHDVSEQVRARQEREALQAERLAAAERRAREREDLYQVFEQAPVVVALLRGPEHFFHYRNPAFQALFPGRALTGRLYAEAMPEIVAAGLLPELDCVYATGQPYFGTAVPFVTTPPDGSAPHERYYDFSYEPYRESGAIVGVSIFAYDVTEQTRAQQEREAERQQLHKLFMEAPAPIVILDGPTLVYQLVNPAYQRIFPGRALLGKPLLDALPEMRGIPLLDDLQHTYDTGETLMAQELPLMMARHDGAPLEEIYWTFTYQARRNARGETDGVLVFAHEVTDQVQARRVVEARETSFQLMADNAPAMLWVTDPAGACTYLNQPWYATTGQTPAEGLGLGWTTAVHPDDAAGAGATFLAANTRREPFSVQFRLRHRDGAYRWVLDQGLPRFDAAGAYEGMVGAVVDVHEQKLAELALQRLSAELSTANQQLTRTNVDLDNFIYTASHDLKAPISNIEGLLYLLQEELPPAVAQDPEVGPTLTRMLDAVDRFKRTIDHLTEVSKLQKEHAPAATLVDLAAVVEDVRQDLAPLLQETGAKLFIDVSAVLPVQFSEKNLRSVVYNLLSNALKYRSPDRAPRVDVRGHVRAGHTVLEIHDNGLGLAADQLPKLFGMFQRLHDHVEGTGIGLYMVKRMVENAGGRIEVHSQLGAGTTFFVFLPHEGHAASQPFPAYLPA
ncbi:hypothetical protein GCM10023185_40110 [Hymenobacter saemangeumensis]|uniref:histidine kinase n=1 Tax=Hymenobacter saemangeumensis TaxID=1084522 RepID=A0ABP8IRW5_9BACT